MFFISLIMRIQTPVFTPYVVGFGATSILIGVILSVTSFTNLVGNLFAGPLIDRFGKKMFITIPLFFSGILFIAHGLASGANQLLVLHALNGFALAFLIPAALALLSGYAKNRRDQGKNMAINGILTTTASIIAPPIGGKMVEWIGYANTYFFIGSAIFLTSLFAVFFLKDRQFVVKHQRQKSVSLLQVITSPSLYTIYLAGFAVMYIHGVIVFEIPYLTVEQGLSTFTTGQLFSYMGLGTFLTLSLFFINRFDPLKRLVIGIFGMSMCQFAIINSILPLSFILFFVGLFFGLIMPAIATAITEVVSGEAYGKAFGVMSAVYSLGMIVSSFITGIIRDVVSPYFIAFLVGMLVVTIIGYTKLSAPQAVRPEVR
ncbi:MFS transporter [Oceanobacillus bengalensis]|uniref:MFS transporter n=2 Tax=Oceanobacillus bengalensis TaxID=1435466 RepID=A0A494YXJ4_9BACI|nr:MFS transporter [Oceanobacillus bengalensis]